jgi:hypothetical protein
MALFPLQEPVEDEHFRRENYTGEVSLDRVALCNVSQAKL